MMPRLPNFIVFISICAFTLSGCNPQTNNRQSQQIESLIEVQKLNEKCIVIKFGADAVTAINSNKGIVVVDAGISPQLTARYRKIIENEFDVNDFAYVINSHSHFDHSGGNSVFKESAIIGHANCLNDNSMQPDAEGRIKRLSKTVEDYKKELQTSEPDTREWNVAFTQKTRYQNAYNDAKHSMQYAKPDLIFSDSLILDMGDITFELIYFGRFHSDSDILIYVPEMSLLFTGDLFFRYGRPGFNESSLPDKVAWQTAVKWTERRMADIDKIIGGHGELLSVDDLKSFIDIINHKYLSENDSITSLQ
jgi:glyoxylase-like metal-dependent hydrolase (beta-lactamase superfamily II)